MPSHSCIVNSRLKEPSAVVVPVNWITVTAGGPRKVYFRYGFFTPCTLLPYSLISRLCINLKK